MWGEHGGRPTHPVPGAAPTPAATGEAGPGKARLGLGHHAGARAPLGKKAPGFGLPTWLHSFGRVLKLETPKNAWFPFGFLETNPKKGTQKTPAHLALAALASRQNPFRDMPLC